ncbi:MAG TPA: YidB family protein [Pseudoxanthomonas sp.]
MLERLIEDTAHNLGLHRGKIEQLSDLLMMLIFDRKHGGFEGFSASFHKLGMQDTFASWSSPSSNQPISFHQAKQIFGVPLIAAMGCKLGIGSVMTARALCCLLPGLIDELTIEGKAPSAIPDSLRSRCIGTFGWLHEVDSAGWIVWRDEGLAPAGTRLAAIGTDLLQRQAP